MKQVLILFFSTLLIVGCDSVNHSVVGDCRTEVGKEFLHPTAVVFDEDNFAYFRLKGNPVDVIVGISHGHDPSGNLVSKVYTCKSASGKLYETTVLPRGTLFLSSQQAFAIMITGIENSGSYKRVK